MTLTLARMLQLAPRLTSSGTPGDDKRSLCRRAAVIRFCDDPGAAKNTGFKMSDVGGAPGSPLAAAAHFCVRSENVSGSQQTQPHAFKKKKKRSISH